MRVECNRRRDMIRVECNRLEKQKDMQKKTSTSCNAALSLEDSLHNLIFLFIYSI